MAHAHALRQAYPYHAGRESPVDCIDLLDVPTPPFYDRHSLHVDPSTILLQNLGSPRTTHLQSKLSAIGDSANGYLELCPQRWLNEPTSAFHAGGPFMAGEVGVYPPVPDIYRYPSPMDTRSIILSAASDREASRSPCGWAYASPHDDIYNDWNPAGGLDPAIFVNLDLHGPNEQNHYHPVDMNELPIYQDELFDGRHLDPEIGLSFEPLPGFDVSERSASGVAPTIVLRGEDSSFQTNIDGVHIDVQEAAYPLEYLVASQDGCSSAGNSGTEFKTRKNSKGRGRAVQSQRSLKMQNSSRVAKPGHSRRTSTASSTRASTLSPARISSRQSAARPRSTKRTDPSNCNEPFVCCFARYGCERSFKCKNEWKRHVASQHLQLGYFRCDVGECNKLNDPTNTLTDPHCRKARETNHFNRKDLFRQHFRRMHAPWVQRGLKSASSDEESRDFDEALSISDVWTRCWRNQREPPPRSRCGFCGAEFAGPQSWDERMEHVGRHYESGRSEQEQEQKQSTTLKPQDGHKNIQEDEDVELREWAIRERIVVWVKPGKGREGAWRLSSLS